MTIRTTMLLALLLASMTTACDREGPAERLGEKVDDAAEEVEEAGEEVAEEVEEACEDATGKDC